MENNAIMPFQNNAPATVPASSGVSTAMVTSRQTQEVQAMAVLAKRFPRNESEAWNRIMNTCKRQSLAERAMYEYPRGGEKVTGPSIRLAEAIAQNWGNIDFGFVELENKNNESTVMAFCWDLETNTRQSKVFAVPHVRATKKGKTVLTDPRDIYEMVANQAARRVRSCILGIIPGDIVDAAVAVCKQTIVGDVGQVHEKVQGMLDVFREEFGVSQQAVERYIGCNASAFTPQTIVRLRSVYTAIKEGRASLADYFGDEKKPALPPVTAQTAAELPEIPADKNVAPAQNPGAQANQGGYGGKRVNLSEL